MTEGNTRLTGQGSQGCVEMNDVTKNTREIMSELYNAVDKCEDSLPHIIVEWMQLQKDPVYIKRYE